MISSMTGYGKGVFVSETIKITAEIKSINSKQLDLTMRLPVIFKEQENNLRSMLASMLERGKIELTVNYENLKGEGQIKFNPQVIKRYKEEIEQLAGEIGVDMPTDLLPLLLRLPEAMTPQQGEADEEETSALQKSIEEAAANLMDSRLKEGKGLYSFFFEKLERIREFLNLTEKFESERVLKIREKLEQQLSRLQGVEIDRGRLEQELIFYIEKLDVAEEKQRLRSHLDYFEETLGGPEERIEPGKGKKLGFISQEMGREINTLGSKSNDAEMQKLVVMMKDELEQIKEQVLNVL